MTSPSETIKITEAQYQAAVAGMLDGKVVTIDGGFAIIDPPEPEAAPEIEPEA
ncbi:hypothetical protein [Shinella sumterensis]|nr:hypothetical protein [Shinella sumterensis]MCD1264557.1 hypothetical protein [Shinella sumterensis]